MPGATSQEVHMDPKKLNKSGGVAGTHPNSLKNLKPAWTACDAREAQKAGVAKRKANKLARETLKMSIESWKGLQDEIKEDGISAVDLLKVLMHQKLEEGDTDTAIDIAKSVAEFEQPKLARVESKVEEVKSTDLTDEELDARLKELMKPRLVG